jgi:hypothetical protein
VDLREAGISEPKDVREDKIFEAGSIKEEFENKLREENIDNWSVIITEDASISMSVDQGTRQVRISPDHKMRETKMRATIAHEMVHIRRRENGERSKLKLLGLGLDKYAAGEEGVAQYEQAQIEGLRGFNTGSYMAVCLARGMDGTPRDFRRLFEVYRDYGLTMFARAGSTSLQEGDMAGAENWAYSITSRAFTGTTGESPGMTYNYDLSYLPGAIGIIKMAANDNPEMKRFMVGKYDPLNPRHVKILNALEAEAV